jgi:RNA polymerase sigma-70 factor, ECF subfamily
MPGAATLPIATVPASIGPVLLGMDATERRQDHRDRKLAVALQRGDEAAIEELYGRYAGTVLAYLVSRLGDRAGAEDVLQQTFAELWRRARDYDPDRAAPFTWVMMVARSRATDHQRRKHPEPHEPERTTQLADRRSQAEPTRELIERWRVAELLRRVPADEAGMLRMRFYDGLSQREIAERTGTPLGTVKMRMIQALGRMRTLMQEDEL